MFLFDLGDGMLIKQLIKIRVFPCSFLDFNHTMLFLIYETSTNSEPCRVKTGGGKILFPYPSPSPSHRKNEFICLSPSHSHQNTRVFRCIALALALAPKYMSKKMHRTRPRPRPRTQMIRKFRDKLFYSPQFTTRV